MELAVPCPSCKLFNTCNCKPALVSFFSLLHRVEKRVLSTKAASNLCQPQLISAGIDKLDIQLQAPIEIAQVLEQVTAIGYNHKVVTLKSRRPYLRISLNEIQLDFTLDFHRNCITGLVSNPNKFGSWRSYITFLENILTSPIIQSAKIQRLDLNMDFNFSFLELIQQIDIKNKSTAISFDEKSGQRTGINIGKKPELIVIYDKSEKDKTLTQRTRIEIRLSGPKLKVRSIYDLPDHLRTQSHFNNLLGTEIHSAKNELSENQNQRLQEFMYTLKRDGLYSARKHMGKMRNFDRDFTKLLKIEVWPIQPPELFKQGIERFLKPSQVNLKLIQ